MSKGSPPAPITATLVTASKPVPKLLSPDVAAEAVDALPDDAPVLPPPTTASATAPPASPAAMTGSPDAAIVPAGAGPPPAPAGPTLTPDTPPPATHPPH